MDELETTFGLEDILREFGSPSARPEPEELFPAPEPEIPEEPEPAEEPAEEVTADTIRLDQIRKAVSQSTPDTDATAVFDAVATEEEAEEEEYSPLAEEEFDPEVEPFSEEWEPEYDEPMGDYPTPEPIRFHHKARQKELRAKLVAGPEHLYYTLTELGVGRLRLSILLNAIIFIVSAGLTGLYTWGLISPERLQLVIFVQFLSLLLSALLGCYRLMEGVTDLLHLRFTTGSLLVFTFIICLTDSILCLSERRIPVSAAFSLEMTMASLAVHDRRNTQIRMMDTLRRATRLDSVVCVPDFYQGCTGIGTGQGEVEHFMDQYSVTSQQENVLNWYALATLGVSLAAGILGGIRHGFSTGVQLCAASALVGMPATAFLSISRPTAILEKQLHKLGAVLCGWKGIRAAGSKAVYPLHDADLFPAGATKLNGVKFYGDRDPDLVVAYATALIKSNGGALVSMFSRLLDSRNGYYYKIDNFTSYPGGIGGEIGDDVVLLGTLEFMKSMEVDMGACRPLDQAVYAAIDGEVCGVFAISYRKARSTTAGLRTLCSHRGLTPMVLCDDFMLTKSFIHSRFGILPRHMEFPPREMRQDLLAREPAELDPVIALTTREGLAPKAFAVTGARVLGRAMTVGVALHMAAGILGLLIMLIIAYMGPGNVLSSGAILLYQLIWLLPAILITEWPRTI